MVLKFRTLFPKRTAQPHLFFHGRPHVRVNKIGVDFLVTVNEDDPQGGGDELAARADGDVVALADVVDVDRDGGVCKKVRVS